MFEPFDIFMDDPTLESVEFHTEEEHKQILGTDYKRIIGVFRLVYTIQTETEVRKVTIPRAIITLSEPKNFVNVDVLRPAIGEPVIRADLFGTRVRLERGDDVSPIVIEDIPKPKKMTVEEIEKALGYKVEIISNE